MQNYVYFDVLDTARTAVGRIAEGIQRANECMRVGQAELKMSVLRGWTPVFPQTFGWDSAALLSYVGEDGPEGASFRWLLAKGFIRIRLRGSRSVWDAALEAFEAPAYRRLGAWPEFNTDDPWEARRPLVEAMRTGKYPAALPESVRNRLDLLRQLSDAAEQAPPANRELPRGDKLRTLIERVAEVARDVDRSIADVLRQCAQISEPNNRTAIDNFLDGQEKCGQLVLSEVRDIVNCCFNSVSAECVEAKCGGLTTPLSQHGSSVEILLRALPRSHRTDLLEGRIEGLSSSDLSGLEVVGWSKIREFLKDKDDLALIEKDREAEAAKLIAAIAIGKIRRYALLTESVNFISKAGIWGGAALVGYEVAGAPGAAAAAAVAVVSGLAGGLGDLDLRCAVRRRLADCLARKWQGLLQAQ
ncbi:MAG: hypothetical protein A2Y76_03955 [Planctomycetes bacterium RBG_13_60_9]|nr:MAG: hypothetical protein A2Y76_03955 [Planctomycetes bacterium RBG_13_60_9]